jgi:acetyl-CoA synthetase
VCRFANVLKALGGQEGRSDHHLSAHDPAAAVAMLACARIGAVHSVVFGGFSPDSLAGRIQDCDSRLVITADEGRRGGRPVPLKLNVDKALERCPDVQTVLMVRHTNADVPLTPGATWSTARPSTASPTIARPSR